MSFTINCEVGEGWHKSVTRFSYKNLKRLLIFFSVFPECLLESRILIKENLRSDETKESVNCSNCVIASLHIASSLVRDLKKTFETNWYFLLKLKDLTYASTYVCLLIFLFIFFKTLIKVGFQDVLLNLKICISDKNRKMV